VLPIVKDIKRKAERVEEEGGRVVLTWLSSGNNCEGYEIANAAAQRAARQQPKAMQSASLSFVKHAVKEKWKPTTRPNKHIQNARKSVAARYLQLKSNHAVTVVHLLRINKVQDARCRKDSPKAYGSMVVYVTKRADAAQLLEGQYFDVDGESAFARVFEPRHRPIQCFKCLGFGYKAFSCTRPQLCSRCA
jgi:ribosomal protein L30/L7E